MRIIKENKNHEIKEFLLVCSQCGSELGVTFKDIKHDSTVECPICGKYNEYDESRMKFIGIIDVPWKATFVLFILISMSVVFNSCNKQTRNQELRIERHELMHDVDSLRKEKELLEETIGELNIIGTGREPQYIVTFRIKQATFTLNIAEHIKNEMNSIDMDIPVTKGFYDKLKTGQDITNDFKYGSLIMDGDFSKLHVTVKNKKII